MGTVGRNKPTKQQFVIKLIISYRTRK